MTITHGGEPRRYVEPLPSDHAAWQARLDEEPGKWPREFRAEPAMLGRFREFQQQQRARHVASLRLQPLAGGHRDPLLERQRAA